MELGGAEPEAGTHSRHIAVELLLAVAQERRSSGGSGQRWSRNGPLNGGVGDEASRDQNWMPLSGFLGLGWGKEVRVRQDSP